MTNININNLIQEAKMWNAEINKLTSRLTSIANEHMVNCYTSTIVELTEILTPLKSKLDYYQIFYTDTINPEISNIIVHELALPATGDIDSYIENLHPGTDHIIVSCRTGRTIEELTSVPHFNYSV